MFYAVRRLQKTHGQISGSDILDTTRSVKERNLESTKVTDGLSLLANAALAMDEKEENINDHLFVSMQDFRQHLPNLLELTANRIHKKAFTLVHHVDKITIATGGNL